jgi:DNA-binding MarR family transcriptional regulator
MTEPAIPQQVLQFVAEQIDTVPQLECLLLLHQHDSRDWLADDVAARIYISRDSASAILQALERRRLLASEGDPPRYRVSPSGIASRELIAEVAVAYQRHLVPIATLIHSKASASVREFARAFDLKKDR